MLTYQRSKICLPQSCSQSVDTDEGGFDPLHFAAYEQLWLTYNALQRTAAARQLLPSTRLVAAVAELYVSLDLRTHSVTDDNS